MDKKEDVKKPSSTNADNSMGIVGVVFGILSILSLSIGGVVMGIVGLVFSIKQSKINKNKWSKAGIILSILGIIIGVVTVYLLFTYAAGSLAQLQGFQGG